MVVFKKNRIVRKTIKFCKNNVCSLFILFALTSLLFTIVNAEDDPITFVKGANIGMPEQFDKQALMEMLDNQVAPEWDLFKITLVPRFEKFQKDNSGMVM
jgi:hypothetical protein